ncbi:Na+/solute symporter [Emticicia oligotrophica DSM 17448]|uniref:Na+/solute symporter n=1 Tax=Emticicia oligotrophica (strain DSM 17448 / CIP 109782 / MTCC 6937 / GPTSA100-15) TaxID=929562 RepID=A0ABM5N2L5_EMTOG|nr:sodium:solute symporter [Emticicia oligotrophica]AFK03698.1 Na+/solute symporter [Emticicia oligotrophica DSM 17448]
MAMWVSLLAYMGVIVFIVIRGALRTKNMADYAVGSLSFSPWAVGLSLAAGMTSAATFIINPGFVAYYGISGVLSMAIFMPIGALISLVVVSKGFRKIGANIKATTLAQWIGTRYESKGFALFFGFLSLLLITFIVLICVGMTQVLSNALGTEILPTLVCSVVFIFGYMMFGGANSMVYTNVIQAFIKVFVGVILLFSGYEHFTGGFDAFLQKLSNIDPSLASAYNPNSPLFRDFFEVVICQLIVGVAIVCQPHIITRSLFLKDEKDVNRYLLISCLVLLFFFSVVFVGLYARLDFPDLMQNGKKISVDKMMSAYVTTHFSPTMSILMVIGIFSAGIATLEGLIQSISATLTSDLIKPLVGDFLIKTEENPKGLFSEFILHKLVIILLAIIAIFISYNQLINPDLSVGIFAQNGVYGYFSAAFVPVLFGTFLKNVPKIVPLVSSTVALVTHFGIYYGRLTPYMQEGTRNPGISTAIAIVVSVLVGSVLYLVTKKTDTK